MKVAVYCRVATKEQCDATVDIKTLSERILTDIKSNRYLLMPKYDSFLKSVRKYRL